MGDDNPTVTGMMAIIRYATRKMLISKRIIVILIVFLLLVIVGTIGGQEENSDLAEGVNGLDVLILFFFMPVLSMMFASSGIYDDIGDRSITQILMSPINRIMIYISYYISVAISISVVMLFLTTGLYLSYFGGNSLDTSALEIYLPMCFLVIIGAMAYSAIFMAASMIFKRPQIFGLFYVFLWEVILTGSRQGRGRVGKLAIQHYLRSMGTRWFIRGDISMYNDVTNVDQAFLTLILLILVFVLFGGILFQRKEFA